MVHAGLALATSVGAMTNSILLILGFKRKGKQITLLESPKRYGKIILAAFVSVGFSKLIYMFMSMSIWMPRAIYLGLITVVMYCVLLRALKIDRIDLVKGFLEGGKSGNV